MSNTMQSWEQLSEEIQQLKDRISELEEANHNLRLLSQTLDNNIELFHALLEHNRAGIVVTAPDRRVLRIVRSLGDRGPTEANGQLLEEMVHPDDGPVLIECYRRLLEREATVADYEVRMINRDGSLRWVSGRLSDMLEVPSVQAMVCNYSDIDDRRRSEYAAAELAALVRNSEYSIFSKAPDGTILTWNRGAEGMFGYAEDEIIGQSIWKLVPLDREDEERRMRAAVLVGGTVAEQHTERIHRDGSRVPILLHLEPVLDSAGRVRSITHISRRA